MYVAHTTIQLNNNNREKYKDGIKDTVRNNDITIQLYNYTEQLYFSSDK